MLDLLSRDEHIIRDELDFIPCHRLVSNVVETQFRDFRSR